MNITKQEQFDQAYIDGDLETVKALINDPDVDPSVWDNLPIRTAAHYGYKEIVELLMQDSRVDPSDRNNFAAFAAAIKGHKEIVELLLTDERVMDMIDDALKRCKEKGGYEFLKGCMERQEKERRVQEAIKEMSADCELYF